MAADTRKLYTAMELTFPGGNSNIWNDKDKEYSTGSVHILLLRTKHEKEFMDISNYQNETY